MLSSLERSTITKAPSREMFISDEKKRSPLEKGDLTQLIIFRAIRIRIRIYFTWLWVDLVCHGYFLEDALSSNMFLLHIKPGTF